MNYVNDNGKKWIDIYVIVENIKTKENEKIKISIKGDFNYTFSEVPDDEWEEIK